MVVGFIKEGDRYILGNDDFCIETQSGYYLSWVEEWRLFLNAAVEISVDGQPMPPAYISGDIGALIPRYDADGS